MKRKEKLAVRICRAERYAIDELARNLNLPASTLARSLLLQEAQRYGFWNSNEANKDSTGVRQDIAGAVLEVNT